MQKLKKLVLIATYALLGYLPFQTFITVWIASNHGNLLFWSALKEIVLILISLIALYLFATRKNVRNQLLSQRVNTLLVTFCLLLVIYLLVGPRNQEALVGFIIHARYLVAFLAAQIITLAFKPEWSVIHKLVIMLGVIVAIFGITQVLFLPPSTLEYFGYESPGSSIPGIPPASHQVAAESGIQRAQATLRGPNVLGAYLILPTLLVLAAFARDRKPKYLIITAVLAGGTVASFSRSALLGLLLAVVFFLVVSKANKITLSFRKNVKIVFAGIVLLAATTPIFLNNQTLRTIVLHENEKVDIMQSNEARTNQFGLAFKQFVSEPFGRGLGTAGPSSALQDNTDTRIAENYFLQVGQEVGWLGFALILLIHVMVAIKLWQRKDSLTQLALLAAFVGLVFTNLVLHTWTDDAVAITYWLLLGIYLTQTKRSQINEV